MRGFETRVANEDILNRPAAELGDADEETPSRLDLAWADALLDDSEDETGAAGPESDENDAAAARFVEALLAEPLVCPVLDDADEMEDGDRLHPLTIDHNGLPTILLFDSEDRLAAYIDDPTSFIVLAGRSFFRLAKGAGAQVALNLDVAPSSTVFSLETVDAIALLADASEEEVTVGAGEALTVAPPAPPAEGLLRAMTARLAADGRIGEAWLVSIGGGDALAPRFDQALALLPRMPGLDLSDLAADLGRLASSFADDERLDIAVAREGEPFLAAARRLGVGLSLPSA